MKTWMWLVIGAVLIVAGVMVYRKYKTAQLKKNAWESMTPAERQIAEQFASDHCEPDYDLGGAEAFNRCREDILLRNYFKPQSA